MEHHIKFIITYCVTADKPMDASKIETFPNRQNKRSRSPLPIWISKLIVTGPKKSRRAVPYVCNVDRP